MDMLYYSQFIAVICPEFPSEPQQLEKLEDFIDLQEQNNIALLETLQSIDSKQMFEKDDEVGSLFTQIKETIQIFKQI